jgi:hypothetical protein
MVVDTVPLTTVLATAEKEIAPVRTEVPAPGALVPVSLKISTVGVVAEDAYTETALTRKARVARKNG